MDVVTLSAYVAASSAEIERARAVMTALQMHGVRVVSTWIGAIEAAGTANEGLCQAARRIAARTCIEEVRKADVFVLLVPHNPSGIGCGVELGYAMALRDENPLRAPFLIASGRTERTIFAALCDEEHTSDAEAIAAVARLAGLNDEGPAPLVPAGAMDESRKEIRRGQQ